MTSNLYNEKDEYGNDKYIYYRRQCACEGRYGSACWDCGSEDGTYLEQVRNDDYVDRGC